MEYNKNSKHGMEQIILAYHAECLRAEKKAEKEYDKDKRSVHKREVYRWCFAQVEAIAELIDKLDIDYDDLEDNEE